ncbi:MAG: superoxide dismutase, partial [Porphyromonadaceae bacterium]|nr:superoxide dismutase [Porphyromonadaceae bacterium]
MKFELIQLPYAADALEPAISAETIAFHHGKHLAGYVNT